MRKSSNMKVFVLAENEETTFQGVVDTQGFRFARIMFCSGSEGRLFTGTKLEHSDDNANWSAIPKLVNEVDYDLSKNPNDTTQPKIIWDISMTGRKRYLRATITHADTGRGQLTATLVEPIDGVTTLEDTGAANYVIS